MGGVTINVQVPVTDDRFPSLDNSLRRVYIPTGIQHMDGAEALHYARSRHGSNDFDRGLRQQRVLLSLREQADPQDLIPRLPDLVKALKIDGQDRHPGRPARAAPRAGLGGRHEEHPVVRVHPALLPEGVHVEPAWLHHRPVHQQDPGRGEAGVLDRSGRRGGAPEARPGAGRRMGPQRDERPGRGTAIAGLSRLPRRGRVIAAPEAAGRRARQHDDRGLQRRGGGHAGHGRLPREDVRGDGDREDRSGDPDRHRGHGREARRHSSRHRSVPDALRRPLAVGARHERAPPTRSASASARIRAAGREPRRSSDRGRAARSARSRPTRPADGRSR